ncbi:MULTISPECIES: helix-turn-helix domain-containing protein [Vibrio harveyi group]|uniref:Helix-turn-helix transcriptional regulator n=1 Tax=Vibrio campbellii TaxID=680 RepID=A0AAQ3B4K7_9VIBR|nr:MULTISPECIES: helix-turn-helix transcriptional regulator [Vibrio harveyi group]MCE7732614.1 helix-turn-helix domain-containing protein [Vibrio campbellii]WDG12005.1 helix-turn-helix transcriptional regulator [Vibrio campbellii]
MEHIEINELIHKQLKSYVSASGFSNSEIARRCGVDRATVGRWLKTGNISRNNLIKLCHVLGVSEAVFLEDVSFSTGGSHQFHEKKKAIIDKVVLLPEDKSYLLDAVDKLLS